ncbi:lipase family protein [Sphingobacterium hungaricum]|uniref:Lipase n=1 Tax=Sphingobacterium hungaricum TaxID=2082723 RepID=A0A928UXC4_9SPHI|nr:lipase family protein [Sphingobacterium hungaricum]MBE8712502.1 lipase [Sphingobacterium hungaricum]
MNKHLLLLFIAFIVSSITKAREIKPGFDKQEYTTLLKLYDHFQLRNDSLRSDDFGYKLVYESEEIGLANKWWLWRKDKTAVIGIRGTEGSGVSWLANIYAAMIPAKGTLRLSENDRFEYSVAEDPKAAVHVGWMISTAYLSREIVPKIDSLYTLGVKAIFIQGHSQGGSISFLLTSHLLKLQETGAIPSDIKFKTYASAAPKPGNLYYAYDLEYKTRNGNLFSVINTADWVPEVPFSIQTFADFNTINPFTNMDSFIKKQSFFKRIFINRYYKRLRNPLAKSQKRFEAILGHKVYGMVEKQLKDLQEPTYSNSNNFTRIGHTIIFHPDDAYYNIFQQDKSVFINHQRKAYLYLAEKYTEK